jgi:hypothetical protein
MIDLKLLRSQPDIVAQAIRNKGSPVNLDLVRKLDTPRSKLRGPAKGRFSRFVLRLF